MEFRNLLRRHSLKVTPQRVAVHQAMLKIGHGSAEQVCEEIAAAGRVKVTTATVYNILSQMALLGIYSHRLSIGNKMVFDVTTGTHLHLYDTYSGTYKDIEDAYLTSLVLARLGRRKFRGYRVDGIDISILCHPSNIKKKRK